MKLLSIDGQPFSIDHLKRTIQHAKATLASIECIVENDDVASTLTLAYHGGEQYPALERIAGTKDRLFDIAAPR
ncbi:hypothetical protein [Dyella sp.]|uniref:hypothetical protein n=1 Tax=Dyella sp. TaxID=1869338 RepID=UPI002B47C95E|nr:hypothetical protein [Dyella sp.]HKT29729.1 hypothetical protein [Dyella sp.]